MLKWKQDSGTVETYAWRIEAIGAHDVRPASSPTPRPSSRTDTNPLVHAVPVDQELLPGQLYRWKVDATDFFDNDGQQRLGVLRHQRRRRAAPTGPTALDRPGQRPSRTRPVTIDAVANDQSPAGGALTLVGRVGSRSDGPGDR